MTAAPPRWSGFLHKGGNGIIGRLIDAFGMVTRLTGVPAVRDGVSGYTIEADLIETPDFLALPADDQFGICYFVSRECCQAEAWPMSAELSVVSDRVPAEFMGKARVLFSNLALIAATGFLLISGLLTATLRRHKETGRFPGVLREMWPACWL